MKLLNRKTNEEKTVVGSKSNNKFRYFIVWHNAVCHINRLVCVCARTPNEPNCECSLQVLALDILLFWLFTVVSLIAECGRHSSSTDQNALSGHVRRMILTSFALHRSLWTTKWSDNLPIASLYFFGHLPKKWKYAKLLHLARRSCIIIISINIIIWFGGALVPHYY